MTAALDSLSKWLTELQTLREGTECGRSKRLITRIPEDGAPQTAGVPVGFMCAVLSYCFYNVGDLRPLGSAPSQGKPLKD